MKAIILAAGKSTRLYPLTSSLPKCLLLAGEKTILDHQIEALIKVKIKEVVLVVGSKKQMIYDHLAKKKYPIKITYIENNSYETTSPILGGLLPIKKYMNEPFIFFHCDVLFEYNALIQLLEHPDKSVMLYREKHWDDEAGKIIVDQSTNYVQELGKDISEDRSTGEYLQIAKLGVNFNKLLMETVSKREKENQDGYTIDAFNDVVQKEPSIVTGLIFNGFCMEIDTKEDYETAKKAWEK